jgi:hypothetical protein
MSGLPIYGETSHTRGVFPFMGSLLISIGSLRMCGKSSHIVFCCFNCPAYESVYVCVYVYVCIYMWFSLASE